MPPGLGALTSLTDGGSFVPNLAVTSGARGATGAINVGGLNVPPLSGANNIAIFAILAVAVFFIARGR